jgi:hypothetical protein
LRPCRWVTMTLNSVPHEQCVDGRWNSGRARHRCWVDNLGGHRQPIAAASWTRPQARVGVGSRVPAAVDRVLPLVRDSPLPGAPASPGHPVGADQLAHTIWEAAAGIRATATSATSCARFPANWLYRSERDGTASSSSVSRGHAASRLQSVVDPSPGPRLFPCGGRAH